MDKRTLLFLVLITFLFFGINHYFDRQREESTREWAEQHKTRLEQKKKKLESEIATNTAKINDLPYVFLYLTKQDKQPIASGLLRDGHVLSTAWAEKLPDTIYAAFKGQAEKQEFRLDYSKQRQGGLAVYRDSETPLQVGHLPDLGSYYLQLFFPGTESEQSKILLGHYVDGKLEIISEKISKIERDLGEQIHSSPPKTNAIALLKVEEEYLPVGIYNPNTQKLTILENFEGLKIKATKPQSFASTTPGTKKEEQFYVLETPYQQLVFSTYGGALAEINLPFKSPNNTDSVVKEIEFDREMVEKYPYNAHFPMHSYFVANDEGKTEEKNQGKVGGYYPLIRRDLIEANSHKIMRVNPRFYALNIVSEYPELAELVYEVKEFDKNHIVFEASQPHRRITKRFSVAKVQDKVVPYAIDLQVSIEGDSRGLWLNSGVPEVEWVSGSPAPVLKYRITRNQKPEVEQIDLPKDVTTISSIYPDWICTSNGFFGIIQDPLSQADAGYRVQYVSGTMVPSRLVELSGDAQKFKAQDLPGYMTLLPLKTGSRNMEFRLFAGPFATTVLKEVDAIYANPKTGYNPDYIACQSFHGWFAFISEPFAKFLLILMQFFYYITHSWAFSIILLTVALRIMMYPLNAWSSKSMARMQQIAPEVNAIQERYKKDPRQAQIEIMNLYRDKGVNPFSGCLPLIIQMPFLIGMFDLLKSTFELRGASFIPGWIDDLAAPDVLFRWNTPIFFIGNEFHVLPILLGLVMFLQQRLMSSGPKDPSQMTDQQRQQRAMGTVMAIVFTLMFYNFPSGLNIYWLSSMLLGILQQWWTNKTIAKVSIEKPMIKGKKQKA